MQSFSGLKAILLAAILSGAVAWTFLPHHSLQHTQQRCASPSTRLFMGRSMPRGKQLIAKIMKEKREKLMASDIDSLTPEQILERNDRLRFEELLRSQGAGIYNDVSDNSYLNAQQEEEEITAKRSGVERIYEGDPAPTECFDELIAIRTEEGVKTSDLIPWKHKNPHRRGDYLVIICDPRPESPELRAAVKSFLAEVPTDILKRMIVVNADSPSKNRRWLRKDGLEFSKISVYSDEKMEFMRSYTALGDKRFSMTMFIIADEKVKKVARNIDQYGAAKTIRYAVKSLSQKSL